MNRKQNTRTLLLESGIALALVLTMVLGLALPGVSLERETLQDPLADQALSDVTVLQVGDALLQSSPIAIPTGEQTQINEWESTRQEEITTGETLPPETQPGEDREGNDQGDQGGVGEDSGELDLAVTMSWYKYGTQERWLTCSPMQTVAETINTAQLADSTLRYRFQAEGSLAGQLEGMSIAYEAGDGTFRELESQGELAITPPQAGQTRRDTFRVSAYWTSEEGSRQKLTFTFTIRWENVPDLELTLTWTKNGGGTQKYPCSSGQTQAFIVDDSDLAEQTLRYSTSLSGALAKGATIRGCEYTKASGGASKSLKDPKEGTMLLSVPTGEDQEVYYLDFTVEAEGQTLHFYYRLTYRQTADVKLSFSWLEGTRKQEITCAPEGTATRDLTLGQLSGGSISYEMTLSGADLDYAMITSAICLADDTAAKTMDHPEGNLAMSIPEGAGENTYRIRVTVIARGQNLHYEIRLRLRSDVALRLWYTAGGEEMSLLCQQNATKTAEDIYDDQLESGMLSYRMALEGADSDRYSIKEILFHQTGSSDIRRPEAQGQVPMLLKEGKTGQNTFTVTVESDTGESCTFKVNLPYKHRGENSVTIDVVNLTKGQTVINETPLTVKVLAWSQASNQYIPAKGTDTRLEVSLDGEAVEGLDLEYTLNPQNPAEGDSNTHILRIYAEDAYGNYGEAEWFFYGQRRQPGTAAGTASIYVDMTVLGLGVRGPISYQVLADEPLSYVVAKAILGQDTGEPFGAAQETLGWTGQYSGTLDTGFYLRSLTTGLRAETLEAETWPGSTEEAVLAAIDQRFGARTGLATLWRCIYRNNITKSGGSGGSFGELDYTAGSGWLYSVGGTYYPGQSMSYLYLKDGDILYLRYTLAYGWDVGSGTEGYGNTQGYCVTARGGEWSIHHQMEEVTAADGTTTQVCRCCGIVETCTHANAPLTDQGDGTHVAICQDCQAMLGTPAYHQWAYDQNTETHYCTGCGARETHFWRELDDSTATCTQPGLETSSCDVCGMIKEETVPPTGHMLDNRWDFNTSQHYRKCSQCQQEQDRGSHSYVYDSSWDDYICQICGGLHEFDIGCDGNTTILSATCQQILYRCDGCGYTLTKLGTFDQYHSYQNGICQHCGQPDPTAHTHDHRLVETVEPDCQHEGYQFYQCSCGDNYSVPIPVTDHSWSQWLPDEAEPEKEKRACLTCGQEESRYLTGE